MDIFNFLTNKDLGFMTLNFSAARLCRRTEKNSIESFYAKLDGGEFRRVFETEKELPAAARSAYEDFRAYLANEDFSCVGAKAAMNGSLFRVGFYDEMNAPETNRLLAHDLKIFADEQRSTESNYASFTAIFGSANFENELIWENSL